MLENIIKICPILISLVSLVYTILLNRKTRKIREKVEKVQLDVIKASELYVHVKNSKKVYEDAMTELIVACSNEELGIEIVQEKFLKAYNRYTDFFNEVNDFCIMVNIGAIKAENYIKNTISVNLSKYATIQYDTFASLQGIAHKYGFELHITEEKIRHFGLILKQSVDRMDSSNFSKKQCNALDNTLDKTYFKEAIVYSLYF